MKKIYISILFLIAFCSCVSAESMFLDDRPLGEKTLLVLTNTIVFIDGECMPPPNIVSRREGAILINGRVAETLILWPPETPIVIPEIKEPPVMPASITETTAMYDDGFKSIIIKCGCIYIKILDKTRPLT